MSRHYLEHYGQELVVLSAATDERYFLKAQKRSKGIVILVEPFTWASVGIKLAEGAIAYIGGQALAKILGGGVDIGALIRNAVDELERFIKQVLEQQVIDECQAYVNSLTRDLLAYENAPSSSAYRLDNADVQSSRLMSVLGPKGRTGLGPYAQAVSLRLLTLQVRAKHYQEKGELRNLINTVDEAMDHVDHELAKIGAEYDYDTKDVGPVSYWGEGGEIDPGDGSRSPVDWCANFDDIDGTEHAVCGFRDAGDAIKALTQERERYIRSLGDIYETAQKNIVLPFQEIVQIWIDVKTKANEQLNG